MAPRKTKATKQGARTKPAVAKKKAAARKPAAKRTAGRSPKEQLHWTGYLGQIADAAYRATDGLMGLCDDAGLAWKPATGANWMTTGQLLEHLLTACGFCADCFEKNRWPDFGDDMLPAAEHLPTAGSVSAARVALAKDKELFLAAVRRAGESRLTTEKVTAPWNPTPYFLAQQMAFSVEHLIVHKAQLYYYLKLQGKQVHTGHLYGM